VLRHLTIYTTEKPKWLFNTHARGSARHAWCLGLLSIQGTRRPTHCKWWLSPHISNIDPPHMVGHQGRRSITPTTSKEVCGFCSSM
jgi:hypothetical protein